MAEKKAHLRSLLMKVKKESEKAGLQLNITKTKVMTNCSLKTFKVDGEEIEVVNEFVFLGSLINGKGESDSDIRRRLTMGRRAMDNLNKLWKSKDVALKTKVKLAQTLVFPVVTYGGESWTVKKADRRKIDTFELWCWRRLLRISWTEKRTNAYVLDKIKPKVSLEAMILRNRLRYFGHIMRADSSLEKPIMLGIVEGSRGRGRPKRRWLDTIMEDTQLNITELAKEARDRQNWRRRVHGIMESRTRLNR